MAGKWRGGGRSAARAPNGPGGGGGGAGGGGAGPCGREGPEPLRRPQDDRAAGALVEPRQAAAEIGWEALLAGQLLEPAADLAQRLRPAAGRGGPQRGPGGPGAGGSGGRGAGEPPRP